DPLAEKNRQYTDKEAIDILSPLFQEHNLDPGRPILTAISRYDVHKNQATVLKAFARLLAEAKPQPRPQLIFLGNTATDDPEGAAVLEGLKKQAEGMKDVHFWVNVADNDRVVGALMSLAKAKIHVSTKEGFGLVVSEALWQGTPVIGSKVGGIVEQVVDGRTGYLVEALDVEALAAKMARVLENPDEAQALGAQGREHVRANFLLPELIRRYLILLGFYSGRGEELPDFRLDDLSYREVQDRVRSFGRHPFFPD
ncbi:MAG: glycosyltransferase, partial [Deltaproteobacteria bacterium]|nr:glycosyltransferase [Deltaproteobacteria bacterium]